MHFKLFNQSIILSLLLLASCANTGKENISIKEYEPSGTSKIIIVDEKINAIYRNIFKYNYPAKKIIYWTNNGVNTWILLANGKHGIIETRATTKNGIIKNYKIISSKETFHRQISSNRFLRQFNGISLKKRNKLNNKVDAISGATVSSTAIKNTAIFALRLDEVLGL